MKRLGRGPLHRLARLLVRGSRGKGGWRGLPGEALRASLESSPPASAGRQQRDCSRGTGRWRLLSPYSDKWLPSSARRRTPPGSAARPHSAGPGHPFLPSRTHHGDGGLPARAWPGAGTGSPGALWEEAACPRGPCPDFSQQETRGGSWRGCECSFLGRLGVSGAFAAEAQAPMWLRGLLPSPCNGLWGCHVLGLRFGEDTSLRLGSPPLMFPGALCPALGPCTLTQAWPHPDSLRALGKPLPGVGASQAGWPLALGKPDVWGQGHNGSLLLPRVGVGGGSRAQRDGVGGEPGGGQASLSGLSCRPHVAHPQVPSLALPGRCGARLMGASPA